MINNVKKSRQFNNSAKIKSEKGSALVIALLILLLLMAFAALAISRTTTEIQMTGNDVSEGKAYAASEASLESMTRDFVDVFERKLVPTSPGLSKRV